MTDKDLIADILSTEKSLVINMAFALNEASCEPIYEKYFEMFDTLSKEVKILFNIQYNKSWYQLEEEKQTKIDQEYNKLKKELNE